LRDYFGVYRIIEPGNRSDPAAGIGETLRETPVNPPRSAMLVSMLRLPLKFGWLAIALFWFGAAQASECPSSQSEIATDRPDVTNSSLVVPAGSLQSENGINASGQRAGSGFDGTNSRLRFGVAPCLELLVDIPNYVGRLSGTTSPGFTNVTPAVKWQVSALPEQSSLSVVVGAGLPTGTPAITGPGLQPYLQFPWSYELGDGWGISGMLTSFFRPADFSNRQTTEATFVIEKNISEKMSLFAEYVGDYPSRGASIALLNFGGGYLLSRTQQIDFHVALGLNSNSPNYIVGVGYSLRLDNVLNSAAR
jgi:Putative MetA-pathway of phenol degradation